MFSTRSSKEAKTEAILLPIPITKNLEHKLNIKTNSEQKTVSRALKSPAKNARNLLVLVGNVDFCLQTYKLHPQLNALWDIYGILLKVINGKQRFECILVLRNAAGGRGPVLQSVYYDFLGTLKEFQAGCSLRVIGHFIGPNRLRAFKLQKLNYEICAQNFTRIQNVSSFVLQSKIEIQTKKRVKNE